MIPTLRINVCWLWTGKEPNALPVAIINGKFYNANEGSAITFSSIASERSERWPIITHAWTFRRFVAARRPIRPSTLCRQIYTYTVTLYVELIRVGSSNNFTATGKTWKPQTKPWLMQTSAPGWVDIHPATSLYDPGADTLDMHDPAFP